MRFGKLSNFFLGMSCLLFQSINLCSYLYGLDVDFEAFYLVGRYSLDEGGHSLLQHLRQGLVFFHDHVYDEKAADCMERKGKERNLSCQRLA